MFLYELSQPITDLKGVGPNLKKQFTGLRVYTIKDLLCHLPRTYEDRKSLQPIARTREARQSRTTSNNEYVNTVAQIIEHQYFYSSKGKTLKVVIFDGTAKGELLCFGRNFLQGKLTPGRKIFIAGTFYYKYGTYQSSTFEFEPYSEHPQRFGIIIPHYPLSGTLKQGQLRSLTRNALKLYGRHLEDTLPQGVIERHKLVSAAKALYYLHFPHDLSEIEKYRASLAFQELFYLHLQLGRPVSIKKKSTRPKRSISGDLYRKIVATLPFDLTGDQKQAIADIRRDLSAAHPMLRLLQGEVGSGKTLVAFLTALLVVENGEQVAFMAPTELLARQHADNADRLLRDVGVRTAFLSGTITKETRAQLLTALENGEVDLLIGTHALFTQDVAFQNLGYVIVDEQHRFGVIQRVKLLEKGKAPDLLLMTATPIPRSLGLTIFGDLDISSIKELPLGRKQVKTHLAVTGKENKVYQWVKKELSHGRQAYFVYPLIQQSEKIALKNAETMFDHLKHKVFPRFTLGLIHSRLPEDVKRETMSNFTRGAIDILVSTSVVEVGVDVANATCMVIEHAERFGLSALHQLRGRVGRGEAQAYAFLIYSDKLTEEGKQRLKTMMEYSDGFSISEEDLKLRGPGDFFGKEQSGHMQNLQFTDFTKDLRVMQDTRQEARTILAHDPAFIKPEHKRIMEVMERAKPFEDGFLSGG